MPCVSLRPLLLALLCLPLSGCADDGPHTWRFKGPLDRSLTEAEQEEIRDVAGDFEVESTLIGCGPEVDPYDCNEHWLRVDDITQRRCDRAVETLEGRSYWRRPPTCDQPPDDGI